jgi:uncharacterized protein (DUF433 family)
VSRKIAGRDIISDIRAGVRKKDLMRKYGLSEGDLQKAIEQIAHERKARAVAIAGDLKAGLPVSDLMTKYQLSETAFRTALAALVDENLIGLSELSMRTGLTKDSIVLNLRKSARHTPAERMTICDQAHPLKQYLLQDFSEHGLCIIGMSAQVNQISKLAILGDDNGQVIPFEFEAECRWTVPATSTSPARAGFRITKISSEDSWRLREIIRDFSAQHDAN